MARLIFVVLYIALVVYALADAVQSDDEERHGLPKALWVSAIIFLPFIGSIVWIAMVHVARRNRGQATAERWNRAANDSPAPGDRDVPPAGPEDDPEYMWLLEQERRKRDREDRGPSRGTDDGGDESAH